MSDSEFQRQVDAATGTSPQPEPAPSRFFWQRRDRARAERRHHGLASESNIMVADDLFRSGRQSARPETLSAPRHGADRPSGPVDPYLPNHEFGGGGAGSAATPGVTSSSGASNTLLGVGLLASSPGGSATPAVSAGAAPIDGLAGTVVDESTGTRSLIDGGNIGNVASGGGETVFGIGSDRSGDAGSGLLESVSSGSAGDDGPGLLDGMGSGGSGDGGSRFLDGIASGGSGDSGGLLDGLSEAAGCFDFGCSSVVLLFFVSVSALIYLI